MRSRNVHYFNLDRRTRVLSSILLVRLASDVATEPPPTFPFLESQCQRAISDVNYHHAREATPPARQCPAGGVGAVYRRGFLPCQTGNRAGFAFFCRHRAEPACATAAECSAFWRYWPE